MYSDGHQEKTNQIQGVNIDSKYDLDTINTWLDSNNEVERSAKRVADDLKDYNTTLEAQAAQLGTTADALEFYAIAMNKAAKTENKKDRASAESIAQQYKFNKAYNEAVSVYYDNEEAVKAYQKALQNNEEVAYDVADAMGEVAKA